MICVNGFFLFVGVIRGFGFFDYLEFDCFRFGRGFKVMVFWEFWEGLSV